jgi:hypothetical protein
MNGISPRFVFRIIFAEDERGAIILFLKSEM